MTQSYNLTTLETSNTFFLDDFSMISQLLNHTMSLRPNIL